MEFKLREADFGGYPKGLILGIGVMDNWLYDGNPIEGLCYNKYLAALREGLKPIITKASLKTICWTTPIRCW